MFNTWKWRSRLSSVQNLLELEREMLLSGNARKLDRLTARREEAEAAMRAIPDDVLQQFNHEIARIRQLATRNTKLLRAYIDGARQGTQRLAEIDKAQAELGTYGRDGSRISPTATSTSCHRRA